MIYFISASITTVVSLESEDEVHVHVVHVVVVQRAAAKADSLKKVGIFLFSTS